MIGAQIWGILNRDHMNKE